MSDTKDDLRDAAGVVLTTVSLPLTVSLGVISGVKGVTRTGKVAAFSEGFGRSMRKSMGKIGDIAEEHAVPVLTTTASAAATYFTAWLSNSARK